ncbi:MAG TPA: methyltransferase [Burkholderiales bacterium]|nr:methyltransferase [Burkholderiales bacterium]
MITGGVLFSVGAVIAGCCLVIFRRARTTTVPGKSSVKLVTWGPYRFTRNPMYVGLVLAYLGEAGLLKQMATPDSAFHGCLPQLDCNPCRRSTAERGLPRRVRAVPLEGAALDLGSNRSCMVGTSLTVCGSHRSMTDKVNLAEKLATLIQSLAGGLHDRLRRIWIASFRMVARDL